MHDGSIEARSTGLDEGSEFVVRLPLLIQPPRERAPRIDGPRATALSRCRILVVDDNKDSADTLGMLLRLMGNDIRIAHDGLEAVEEAESFRPELVLLDIGLPKINGYDGVVGRKREQRDRVGRIFQATRSSLCLPCFEPGWGFSRIVPEEGLEPTRPMKDTGF